MTVRLSVRPGERKMILSLDAISLREQPEVRGVVSDFLPLRRRISLKLLIFCSTNYVTINQNGQ